MATEHYACKKCGTTIPEEYRDSPEVVCSACGQAKCMTGYAELRRFGIKPGPGWPTHHLPYWVSIPPPPPAIPGGNAKQSDDATPGAKRGEGEKPKPDGPFNADGFRFAGVEVRFGRAGKQYRLVMALWDAKKNRPAAPRPIEEVISEVWGDENETEESTFRQLCADARRRFQSANCPLAIEQMNGIVQLAPL